MHLYLLCGLAFAGKTTARREIVARTGALVVCPDDINAARGLWGGDGIPDEEWARTHEIASGLTRTALSDGRDVVIDDTMCFRWLRDDYRRIAADAGAETVLVVVDTPLEEIRRRIALAESTGERPLLRPEVLETLVQVFEWPDLDEQPVSVETLLASLPGE